jgi:hypothetical protein
LKTYTQTINVTVNANNGTEDPQGVEFNIVQVLLGATLMILFLPLYALAEGFKMMFRVMESRSQAKHEFKLKELEFKRAMFEEWKRQQEQAQQPATTKQVYYLEQEPEPERKPKQATILLEDKTQQKPVNHFSLSGYPSKFE